MRVGTVLHRIRRRRVPGGSSESISHPGMTRSRTIWRSAPGLPTAASTGWAPSHVVPDGPFDVSTALGFFDYVADPWPS
jgi:hypothetical protein